MSAACATAPAGSDPCSWAKPIATADIVVVGGRTWTALTDPASPDHDPAEILSGRRDVLTPGTAGQIAAHNAKWREFCAR